MATSTVCQDFGIIKPDIEPILQIWKIHVLQLQSSWNGGNFLYFLCNAFSQILGYEDMRFEVFDTKQSLWVSN